MGERLFIESLEPRTKERCQEHKHRAKLEGIETLVTAGARTWSEQLLEYEKGRKRSPRGWIEVDPKLIVTHSPPGKDAPHMRRAAYDLYPIEHGVLCTMDRYLFDRDQIEKQLIRFWLPIVRIGHELGLHCGADWPRKDFPHFERPDWRTLPEPDHPGLEDIA